MKSKCLKIIPLLMCMLTLLGGLPALATTPYDTYIYSVDGLPVKSPDAYVPDRVLDADDMLLETPLSDPRDLVVDSNNNVYIADTKNNRIVVLNSLLQYKFEIMEFVNSQGVPDLLNAPQGVFVTTEYIYVADTGNARIVVFNLDGSFAYVLEAPSADVFPEGSIYTPVAVAVDLYGRIYVVSSTTYMGIISLDEDGQFSGFIGAQKVNPSAWDLLWRRFQTEEQQEMSSQYTSTEFNNITVDSRGFIYATISSIDESAQQSAIKSKDSANAPVKMLNTRGEDVLKRNGFFAPGGEVNVGALETSEETSGSTGSGGASAIIDVALGPDGTWSIVDSKRQKIYTYDDGGELLFVYGDTGTQVGNLASVSAIAYQDSNFLALDRSTGTVSTYRRTEYGNLLITALGNNRKLEYGNAFTDWQSILQRNSNFDASYIGIGKSLYRDGKYEEAMEYYKYAYDTSNYDTAFKAWRQEWVEDFVIVVPIVIVAVVIAYSLFFKYARRVNVRGQLKTTKRTYWEELMYGFWVIFHPFDGFWDLKHEKRGSLRGAMTYLVLTILAFTYNDIGAPYLVNPYGTYSSLFTTALGVIVPFALWCVANWCLTTLFDGEGSFKDIVVATGYALVPIPLMMFPFTIAMNVLLLNELSLATMFITIGFVWTGLLIFVGSMITHDYSIAKNLLMCISTLVGMAFIMFIGVLFSSLFTKIVSFVSNIIIELSYRV